MFGKQLFVLLFCVSAMSATQTVQYSALAATRLEYGEPIVITGSFIGWTVSGITVTDAVDIQSVQVTYTVSGIAPKTSVGTITGSNWQVSVDALPENSNVSFTFQFGGQLKPAYATSAISGILNDPNFSTAFQTFVSEAVAKPADVQAVKAQAFVKSLVPTIAAHLPSFIKVSAKATLADSLVLNLQSHLPNLVNLQTNINDAATNGVPGVQAGMTIQNAAAAINGLSAAQIAAMSVGAGASRAQFLANFNALQNALVQAVTIETTAEVDLASSGSVKDFEKYAGLDYGAVYIPAIGELRHFALISTYWGSVENNPAPVTGRWQWAQQRVSFTAGLSVGDISGVSNPKTTGENAFGYGLGLRINKYFRISAGSAIYRSATGGNLSQRLYVAPSLDVSGFEYVKNLFGKNK
jgi:hypothetical protein